MTYTKTQATLVLGGTGKTGRRASGAWDIPVAIGADR